MTFNWFTTELSYNLFSDSVRSHLIIDLRSKEAFEEGCIRNALHLQFANDDETNFTDVKSFKYQWYEKDVEIKERTDFKMRGLLYQNMLIYDQDSTPNSVGKRISNFVQALHKEAKMKPQNIFIMAGGLNKFQKDYEFMISSAKTKKKAADGLFPTAIPVDNMETSFLYLGSNENAKNADQLKKLGITHILNMADELTNTHKPEDFKYAAYGVNDTRSDDIAKYFALALSFIDEARLSSGKVIVHCAMGISRSSAVVIAWVMKEKKISFADAKELVRGQRMCIKPNEGFVKQLLEFEKEVLKN